jgi:hypothetical protein
MSQNITEQTRRSAADLSGFRTVSAVLTSLPESVWSAFPESAKPHAWQNRFPGIAGSPHDGHPPAAAPHSPQNR